MSRLAQTTLSLARRFGVGGGTWTVTREDGSGDTQTIGTATPLYVRQRRLSVLERAFASTAATQQAEWSAYWADCENAPEEGDTLTSASDTTLAFLVAALSTTDRPGVTIAALRKQPYV